MDCYFDHAGRCLPDRWLDGPTAARAQPDVLRFPFGCKFECGIDCSTRAL